MVYLSDELRQVLERYQKGHPEHRIALGGETVEIRENGNGGIKIRRLTVNSPVLFRTLQELKEEQIRQQLPAHLRKSVLPPRSGWLKAILVFDGVETYGIVDGPTGGGEKHEFRLPPACIIAATPLPPP
ncbi:MAG: hypothetical protein AAB619_03355 [Patescibacteria group bacterium]